MVKVEVIEEFTLEKFDELKNLVRAKDEKVEENLLKVGDTFECDKKMADYLTGNNPLNKVVVKVIEIMPEKEIQKAIDEAVQEEKIKPTRKRTSKKK